MFSLSSQIEYIVGRLWNIEYTEWYKMFYNQNNLFMHHALSRINWVRELLKLHKDYRTPYISSHPDFTWDIIQANPKYSNWYYIPSENPNITWDIVITNPNKNWSTLIMNPNITWDIIQANPQYPWNWRIISYNPNITWDIIRDNRHLQWDKYHISKTINLTLHIIQDNPDFRWDWRGISANPSITWDIIRDNPNCPWYWRGVTANPNITLEIIMANKLKYPWDMSGLLNNPNITWDILLSYFRGKHIIVQWNDYPTQAQISMAKHRLKAHRQTNYLARYIRYELVRNSLEYGY